MGKDNTNQINSTHPSLTEELGETIGRNLRGGEVIELAGDLGSGKTTFVRGLARGVGSKDHVASPTFTISRVYKSPKLTLHHMDFYRLDEPGIMDLQIEELVSDKNNVVIVEWAKITHKALPEERLLISFASSAELGRIIEFDCPPDLTYLMEGLR